MEERRFVPVHVSLVDALKGPLVSRELNIFTDDLPDGIDLVNLVHIGLIPAVVGFRTELLLRYDGMFEHQDKWRVVFSPNDEQLLKRLLGREKGELKREVEGVRYDLVDALRVAHVQLSSLRPPTQTTLQICFAFLRDGTPSVEWKASTIAHLVRERDRIILENEVIRAGNLFGHWKFLWWKIGQPLLPIPDVPAKDEWLETHHEEVEKIVQDNFVPVLQSLWRAEFAEGNQSKQLRLSGYKLDAIGQTKIGSGSLSEIVKDRRERLTSLTFLGD
ncbi:hypothetical protein HYV69_01785 [Candidatus Uhrbacteria bacterium]|nr:hypothetical protein [Candidatus Uhrbacteria bacterium]